MDQSTLTDFPDGGNMTLVMQQMIREPEPAGGFKVNFHAQGLPSEVDAKLFDTTGRVLPASITEME